MLKTTAADAADVLKSALATLPSEAEARSDFFVQWRTRTIELLERLFPQDAEPTRLFKELEFSPRRIAKNDPREDQLRLDAYLAGCAAARSLIESLIQKVAASLFEPSAQVQGEAQTPAILIDTTPVSDADGVISGGKMDTLELCAPVRSSLSRVLGAWDRGDRDTALVLSAQLLAELTLLARDDRFKGAFEKVVSNAFDEGATEAVKASAPKCMWSLVAAMNEVMKA
ncbi:MAG TPA: hypothetical protein VIM11_23550 [Tepidisphaeraceae bacterium]|jgi:hypothetical protein